MTRLIRSGKLNWRPDKFSKILITYKVSQEEHTTNYSGLRVSGMALSKQSALPAFFSSQKINLKIGLIPEDDLPRMAKSRKMAYRD
jgi:hypothetical protein